MKAVQFQEYGGPDVLHVAEVPEPHAGPGQIRVAVRAAGVNRFDAKVRSGAMSAMMPIALPRIPGLEVAGVVDEVGEGVAGVAVGDEVFGPAVAAGCAEYALLTHFAAKPAAMSWAEAGGLPVAVETAVRGLDLLGVANGDTVLINGAAGGVGAAATQLAVARGASVIGTASEGNHDYLRSLGATPVTYGEGLAARVRQIASGGVDVAFDTAGQGALPDLIDVTGSAGKVITIADYDAARHGVAFTGTTSAYHAYGLAAKLYEEGRFRLPVAKTFPLDAAAQAHRLSEGGHVRGKLVIVLG
ncbi:MAG TPA: NADP-dependent oxidoreductase [Micromonosporaceae bacterium]|nr:NADP-dependent oxidoreductase [Micromonosporaceae bacterium]